MKLFPKAAKFTSQLINSGIGSNFFEGLIHDSGLSSLKYGLLLAYLSRLNYTSDTLMTATFKPIVLDWKLGKKDACYCAHTVFRDQHVINMMPGQATLLTQLQPKLPQTSVFVLETCRLDNSIDLICEACRYGFETRDSEVYLRRNCTGLGLLHAFEVAREVMIDPIRQVSDVTPIGGSVGNGRSLFVLLDYTAFRDMDDKVGNQAFGMVEVRLVTDDVSRKENRTIVTFYDSVDVLVPKGSLLALANIKWFKELFAES